MRLPLLERRANECLIFTIYMGFIKNDRASSELDKGKGRKDTERP